ncbi:hypothetical protein C8J57DRAFT_1252068 [Mycena rebaudengoi]|nr:hypothetical protein C8J57DRAFT_1252068 [Mycena rebaudengoi]
MSQGRVDVQNFLFGKKALVPQKGIQDDICAVCMYHNPAAPDACDLGLIHVVQQWYVQHAATYETGSCGIIRCRRLGKPECARARFAWYQWYATYFLLQMCTHEPQTAGVPSLVTHVPHQLGVRMVFRLGTYSRMVTRGMRGTTATVGHVLIRVVYPWYGNLRIPVKLDRTLGPYVPSNLTGCVVLSGAGGGPPRKRATVEKFEEEGVNPRRGSGSGHGSSGTKTGKTRNPIYLFNETVDKGTDQAAVSPGDRHFKCYDGNPKFLAINRAMKYSLDGLQTHLRTNFTIMHRLYEAMIKSYFYEPRVNFVR